MRPYFRKKKKHIPYIIIWDYMMIINIYNCFLHHWHCDNAEETVELNSCLIYSCMSVHV